MQYSDPELARTEVRTPLKPNITLLVADHDRLAALAHAAAYDDPETAEMLAEELERAQVVNNGHAPKDIVRMGSPTNLFCLSGRGVWASRVKRPKGASWRVLQGERTAAPVRRGELP